MKLDKFTKIVDKKREELDEVISRNSKEITLQEVADEIILQAEYFADHKFKYGQRLNFLLRSEQYFVAIDNKTLVLSDVFGMKIKIFTGENVKNLYRELFKEVQKETYIL